MYLGLILGSFVGAKIFLTQQCIKPVLVVANLCNGISLIAFALSRNYTASVLIRTATGFFQLFVTIYGPVWADAFAPERTKTIWLSILLLCAPLGIFLGFSITSAFEAHNSWQWSFISQAILAMLSAVGLFFIPLNYLDANQATAFKEECISRVKNSLELPDELQEKFQRDNE